MVLPSHNRFDFSPLPQRADYTWPGGKRLALYIALNIELFGFGMEIGRCSATRCRCPISATGPGVNTEIGLACGDY